MIHVQVQFGHAGDLFTYMAPETVDHGDRVLVQRGDTVAIGHVAAIGSAETGPAEGIIRVLRPGERLNEPEEVSHAGDAW